MGKPQRSGGPETGATCSGPLAWLYRKSVLSRGVVAPSASDRGQPLSFFKSRNGLANPRGAPASKFFFGARSLARVACRVPLLACPAVHPSRRPCGTNCQFTAASEISSRRSNIRSSQCRHHRRNKPNDSSRETLLDKPAVPPAAAAIPILFFFAPWRLCARSSRIGSGSSKGAKAQSRRK